MGLKSNYLAADDYGMDRRSRRLHRFLVSSPVVLLLAISAVGHIRKAPHVGAAGTAEYDRHVMAYRDRVVAVDRIHTKERSEKLPTLRDEAQKWVDGYRSGTLVPLQPAAYEDHLRDGVRGEVLTTGLLLGSRLASRADHALQQGGYAQAASASLLSAETVLGLRKFELQAYLQCVYAARRSMSILEKAWPRLSPSERQALRPRLEALRVDPQEPVALSDLDKKLLVDYAVRQRRPADPPADAAMKRAFEQQERGAAKGTTAYNKMLEGLIGPSNEASGQS